MKLNRKQLKRMILKEMGGLDLSRMGPASRARYGKQNAAQQNVFSIRLLSPGPAYFMDSQQITGEKAEGISMLTEDQMTGTIDSVLLARIAQGMGAEYILDENFQDQNFQDPGQDDLYKPIPIEEYIRIVSVSS